MNDNCMFIFHDTNPAWHKNIKIANEVGSVLDGVMEFFDFKISKDSTGDYVFEDSKYIYYISHKNYCEGMTYIRRIKK